MYICCIPVVYISPLSSLTDIKLQNKQCKKSQHNKELETKEFKQHFVIINNDSIHKQIFTEINKLMPVTRLKYLIFPDVDKFLYRDPFLADLLTPLYDNYHDKFGLIDVDDY